MSLLAERMKPVIKVGTADTMTPATPVLIQDTGNAGKNIRFYGLEITTGRAVTASVVFGIVILVTGNTTITHKFTVNSAGLEKPIIRVGPSHGDYIESTPGGSLSIFLTVTSATGNLQSMRATAYYSKGHPA